MEVLAAPEVAGPANAYFHAVRDLREAAISEIRPNEEQRKDLVAAVFSSFGEVKHAMRADLKSDVTTLSP